MAYGDWSDPHIHTAWASGHPICDAHLRGSVIASSLFCRTAERCVYRPASTANRHVAAVPIMRTNRTQCICPSHVSRAPRAAARDELPARRSASTGVCSWASAEPCAPSLARQGLHLPGKGRDSPKRVEAPPTDTAGAPEDESTRRTVIAAPAAYSIAPPTRSHRGRSYRGA